MELRLGETLRKIRKENDMTQAVLSERSDVADTIISRIETGQITDPKISTLVRLADGLDMPVSEFLAQSETETTEPIPILETLRELTDKLRERFHVKSIGLFGSVARGSAGSDSDVDLLVEYEEGHRDIFNHSRLEEFLERHLDRPVDLVTDRPESRTDHPNIRDNIERDVIRV